MDEHAITLQLVDQPFTTPALTPGGAVVDVDMGFVGGVRAVCACGWQGQPHPTPDGCHEGTGHLQRVWEAEHVYAGDGRWRPRG